MKLGLINSAWAQAGQGDGFRHPADQGHRLRYHRHLRRSARHRCQRAQADPRRVREGEAAGGQRRLRRGWAHRLQPQRPALSSGALSQVSRLLLRTRSEEPPSRSGRVHLGTAGHPARGAVGDRRQAPQEPGRLRGQSRFADRARTGAVQALAPEQRAQHGEVHRRRESPRGAGEHRCVPPATGGHEAGGTAGAQGQGDSRPHQRLRRQGPRRLAAGPGRRELRAVSQGDRGAGHRRRDQHRARILSRTGQDRRVGDGKPIPRQTN